MQPKFSIPLAIPLFLGVITHCAPAAESAADVLCGLDEPSVGKPPEGVIVSPSNLSKEQLDEIGQRCQVFGLPESYLIRLNVKPGRYEVTIQGAGAYGYLLESGQDSPKGEVSCQSYSNCTFSSAPDSCFAAEPSVQGGKEGLGGADGEPCPDSEFKFAMRSTVEVTPEHLPVFRLFQAGSGTPTVDVEAL